jgi:hypothetical protein
MSESNNIAAVKKQGGQGKGGRGGRSHSHNRNGGRGGRGRGGRGGRRNNGSSSVHNNQSHQSNNQPLLEAEEKEALTEEEDALEHHHCLVCYSPTLFTTRGITPCNHDTICASCHLRLRSLLNDKRCPICKAENDTIIIDSDVDPNINEHKSFEQYERWGDDLGPNFLYREDVQMFFPVAYYHQEVVSLFSLQCSVMACNYGKVDDSSNSTSTVTLKGLNHHLAAAHSMSLCQLCVENKRDFISRLPRFTSYQYKEHCKYGDEISNTSSNKNRKSSDHKGHPLCQFCAPKRFYDLTGLHEHLNKDHYKCHVCEKIGVQNQFFRDYHKLNLHFDSEHYLCHHPDCLAARFVVFQNDIDLIAHERDIHNVITRGGTGRSTKINIEFNYRPTGRDGSAIIDQTVPDLEGDFNYGLSGEVFVPDALDGGENDQGQHQENEPEITHGPHAERTALLRTQARQRREELGLEEAEEEGGSEAFPALAATSTVGGGGGWTKSSGGTASVALRGRNATALTQENFPSLGGGSSNRSQISSKLRVNRSAPNSRTGPITPHSSFMSSLNTSARSAQLPSFATTQRNHTSNRAYMNPSANLSSGNFPSLGGGTHSAAGRIGTSSNKYAEAQAYAKKNLSSNNFPSLGGSSSAFPVLSSSSTKKKQPTIFEAKKPPALDNVLDFPTVPLSLSNTMSASDGKAQVEKMKKAMGQDKYKELKKLTRSFACNDLDPESYVASSLSLFEGGIENPKFWEIVPNLISSCPNQSSLKRASRYLDSIRYPVLQSQATSSSRNSIASNNVAASVSRGGGGWSDQVNAIKKSSQKTTKDVWGSAKTKGEKKIGNSVIAAAAREPPKGTATKFMAKEWAEEKKSKKVESEAQQGGGTNKKKKAKAKKNELRELAFGK